MRQAAFSLLLVAAIAAAGEEPSAGALAEAHFHRGEALAKEGKLEEAQREFESARARFQEAKDGAAAAALLANVAEVLMRRQAYAEAIEVWKLHSAEVSAVHGGDHPDASAGLSNAAFCLSRLRREEEALPLLEESLAMRRRLYEGDHPDVAASLNKVGFCIASLGRMAGALPYYRESLAMRQRLFPGDDPDLAGSLNNVGYCLWDLGRETEALPFYQESLAMRRRLLKGDHADLAAAISGVARCLQEVGRGKDAMPLHEESLAMSRRLVNGDDMTVVDALGGLAMCLEERGRYGDALRLQEEALAMCRRLSRGDDPDLAKAMNNVAAGLNTVGRTEEALALNREALAMRRRLFKSDNRYLAASLNAVASSLASLGRDREALPLYQEALEMWQRLSEGDHSDVSVGLNNVGLCLGRLGRWGDATRLLEESLAMTRRLFEGGHPSVVTSLSSVGLALLDLGRPRDALPLLEDSLAMARRLSPGDRLDVATGLNNVALCNASLGREAEALRLHEEALAMWRRLLEGDQAVVARGLNNVAMCMLSLGRAGDALQRCEESLAMWRRLFKGDHPDVAIELNNVATCLKSLGRAGDALPVYRESLAMSRRIFEGDHMHVAVGLSNVAACLKNLGRAEEAAPLYEESLAISRRLIGGDHGHIVKDLTSLAFTLEALGRSDEAIRLLDEAVAMARRLGSPHKHAALANAASVRLKANEWDAALPLIEEAVDQIESLRAEAVSLTDADRALYFAELKRYGAFELAVRTHRALGRDGDALQVVERGRARSLLDLLDRSRLDPLAEVQAQAQEQGDARALGEIAEVSEALRNADAEVGRSTCAASARQQDRAEIAKLNAELASARRAREEVLRRRAQLVRSRIAVAAPADVAALQGLAGTDGRVLVYSVSEEGTTLFLVPPAGAAVRAVDLVWPGGAAVTAGSLAARVAEHGTRIQRGRGAQAGEEKATSWTAGHALFRALVPEPMWTDLRTAKVVYVVADGALQRLPLETLPVDESASAFWIDAGPPLVYGASGSALLWSRERGDRQRSQGRLDEAVVLGDPIFTREAVTPPAHGVVVVRVADEGQARGAGIEPGDVVLAYDKREVEDYEALSRAMKEAREDRSRPSKDTTLSVWRAGERREVKVAVGPLGVFLSQDPAPDAWSAFRAGDPGLARAAVERGAALGRHVKLVPLPGTRLEAEAIAKALGGEGGLKTTLLLGEDATLPKLRQAAPQARYLHIATHGLADETEFASYSSLALTQPVTPTAMDDGFLTLADVLAGWRGALAGCEMVVLSACETQRGYEQRDEGVFALPVGFLYAGAPSVIASLWRVDDASTAGLFADFYGRLRGSGGREKLAAFIEARKAFKRKQPEPYFWAPFVYIGDPR